jgi:hypothetical protein
MDAVLVVLTAIELGQRFHINSSYITPSDGTAQDIKTGLEHAASQSFIGTEALDISTIEL